MYFIGTATTSFAGSILVAKPHIYVQDHGYGGSKATKLTSIMDTATNNNVGVTDKFEDYSLMLQYDAIWLETRSLTDTLSSAEFTNISNYIAAGHKVVMRGEAWAWNTWNNSILSVVGGTAEDKAANQSVHSVVDNNFTLGASELYLNSGGIATGGKALYDVNFATLWGDNVLTILDMNVTGDGDDAAHTAFTENVVYWLADAELPPRPDPSTPIPEPSTMALLGLGFIGLAGLGRKKLNG